MTPERVIPERATPERAALDQHPDCPAPADTTCDAFLGDRLYLLQPKRGYRAGIDAVFLAAAVEARDGVPLRVLDAGAGIGTAGLCVAARRPEARLTLIEQNPLLAELARKNAQANGLAERVSVITADLLQQAQVLDQLGVIREGYDVVLANPPYHELERGTRSANAIKAAAHAMTSGTLERWVQVMARLCHAGGEAILIHKAEALPELLAAMQPRFGGLRILFLRPREGALAHRVIIKGVKGSRAPASVLPGFILHEAGNAFTPAATAVLRRGAGLQLGR